MAKLNRQQIRDIGKSITADNPGGIRYASLVKAIHEKHPETPINSINGSIWNLETVSPDAVFKPSRGLYKPIKGGEPVVQDPATSPTATKLGENDFYEPFAEYLKTDLDEATDAVALGGGGLKSKWGTPDVVGVYKPLASNLVKFPVDIISAEIKVDPKEPVTAFGQAIAYRLFSAKPFIVMPSTITEEDKSRLEALCMLFGVGLVLFDVNLKDPNFLIRVRAQRFSPDMFYVNELQIG